MCNQNLIKFIIAGVWGGEHWEEMEEGGKGWMMEGPWQFYPMDDGQQVNSF